MVLITLVRTLPPKYFLPSYGKRCVCGGGGGGEEGKKDVPPCLIVNIHAKTTKSVLVTLVICTYVTLGGMQYIN